MDYRRQDASEVTTIWRYTNVYIIIIIINKDGVFHGHLMFANPRGRIPAPDQCTGMLFTIMCVRTQKFLAYASSAIFRTCYSLSIRTNFLTYVRLTMIV